MPNVNSFATLAVLLSAGGLLFAVTPAQGGDTMQCYHNEEGVWWDADCNSEKLCLLANPQPADANKCKDLSSASPQKPHPQWVASEHDCRLALKQTGSCSEFPIHPEPLSDATVGDKGCYVSMTFHKDDCKDPELCQLKAEYPTEEACSKSGFPHRDWVADVDACRSVRKSEGSCYEN